MSVGVAFAGGGLKGTAYIGAIKAFMELNVDFDCISGTSSGSMFAAMYALGYKPDEIKNIFENNYKKIIKIHKRPIIKNSFDFLVRKKFGLSGFISGIEFENLMNSVAGDKDIRKMCEINKKVAFATVDAKSTRECVLWSGVEKSDGDIDYISDISVGKATWASMAFPAAFKPCKFRDYIFIDGGTKDNLPVGVLKKMGADRVVGLSFKLDRYKEDSNLLDTILRACDIFSDRDVKNAQKLCDVVIEIDIEQAKLLSIKNIDEAIKIGYDSVMSKKDEILKLFEN